MPLQSKPIQHQPTEENDRANDRVADRIQHRRRNGVRIHDGGADYHAEQSEDAPNGWLFDEHQRSIASTHNGGCAIRLHQSHLQAQNHLRDGPVTLDLLKRHCRPVGEHFCTAVGDL